MKTFSIILVSLLTALTTAKANDGMQLFSRFGVDISMSGDYAIVGAPGYNSPGSAYIFQHEDGKWIRRQKLTASDGKRHNEFGDSVSIGGIYAVVGAPRDDADIGSAYIFQYEDGRWMEKQKLTASDGKWGNMFGDSVSIGGNYAIVKARFDRAKAGTKAGSAYVFYYEDDRWTEKQKLTASDGKSDFFGIASSSGNYAIVGDSWDDAEAMKDTGSAHIFQHRDGRWIGKQKLTANDAEERGVFGFSVSMHGDYAMVGAPGDDSATGSAYVFQYEDGSWVEKQKLIASDGEKGDGFGYSVSMSGDYATVGTFNPGSAKVGSAYIFQYEDGSWVEKQKLIDSDADKYDTFGFSVFMSGDYAMVGAFSNPLGEGYVIGSAHVFHHENGRWVKRQELTAHEH